ncbi:MAG: glucosyl transferase [Ignavibacteriaceae bacterium]|nr:glucosyl transferase [Ignavibacteriaceae bacterium]
MKKFNLRAAVPGYIFTLQFLIISFKKKDSIVMLIRKVIYLFIFFAGLLFLSCNPSEPENKPTGVEFSAEDASCTETWITLKAVGIAGAQVYRGDSLIFNFSGQSIDTTLYDDGLLPNQTYNYNLTMQQLNNKTITRSLPVQTMDTTSHNFTWQMFEFGGEAGSSTLYDVAIIDENNIWAVGEIYMRDSTGQPDPQAYNAVHWDGQKWEVKRIKYYGDCSAVVYPPFRAIWAFNSNDIVLTNGGSIGWFDGNSIRLDCGVKPLLNGSINKIWGTSSSDLYAVGNNGSIAHYDGSNWTKIESGTTLHVYDITGDYNKATNDYEILLVAAKKWESAEKKILKLKNNAVEEISSLGVPNGSLHGIWFRNNKQYLVVGNGIYTKTNLNENEWNAGLTALTRYYTYAIRGSALNNIFICGSFGEMLHFSGNSWHSFKNIPRFFDADFYNIDVKNDIVAAVGQRFNSGCIVIGKK